MKCSPIIVKSKSGPSNVLLRSVITKSDAKDEKWLQSFLYQHPEILPVDEFDDGYSPLISIGMELPNSSGFIDNLFVSLQGKLTLVETKLWKNPEMHRTVVAQLIDYAKEMSQWSYDNLNEAVLASQRKNSNKETKSIVEIVLPYLNRQGILLSDFQESLLDNLDYGEFLLLIVGDKISPNLALLTESIHGAPGLDFRLGLVELQIYQTNGSDDWPILIIPDIIGRTIEKTRSVIKVKYKQEKPEISVEVVDDDDATDSSSKIEPEFFLSELPMDLRPVYEKWLQIWNGNDLLITWGFNGFSLRSKYHIGKKQKYIYSTLSNGLTIIKKGDAEKLNLGDSAYKKYLNAITDVSAANNILSSGKTYISHKKITASDLDKILDATSQLVIADNDTLKNNNLKK